MTPIRFGDKGLRVRALQRRINRYTLKHGIRGKTFKEPHAAKDGGTLRIKGEKLRIDGHYGPKTFNQTRVVEMHSGRFPNGKVGRGLWRLLRIGRALKRLRRKAEERDRARIVPSSEWGKRPHSPYSYARGPLKMVFCHTAVIENPSVNASHAEKCALMRRLDDIGFARGFNGISYSFGTFPDGSVYEGRGFLVVEAASAPYNEESDSIVTVGNTDVVPPTDAQLDAFVRVIRLGRLRNHYAAPVQVRAHREIAAKACPGARFTDEHIAEISRRANR